MSTINNKGLGIATTKAAAVTTNTVNVTIKEETAMKSVSKNNNNVNINAVSLFNFDLQAHAGFETAVAMGTIGALAPAVMNVAGMAMNAVERHFKTNSASNTWRHWTAKAHEAGNDKRAAECHELASKALEFDLQRFAGAKDIKSSNSNSAEEADIDKEGVMKDTIGKVDILTASMDALMELPGVGEKWAKRIMNYRALNTIHSVEDLRNIAGIGDKFIAKVADLVYVSEKKVSDIAGNVHDSSKGDTAAQKYAQEVMRNSIDRRAIRFQKFVVSGGGKDEPLEMAADFSSFGMNGITRKVYDGAFAEGSNVFVANGSVRVLNNIVSSDCIKQPFTDKLIELEMREADSKLAAAFVEGIQNDILTVQFTMDGEVFVHVRYYVGKKHFTYNTWTIVGDEYRFIDDEAEVKRIWKKGGAFKNYGCVYAGPSNQRQVTAILFKMDKSEQDLKHTEAVAAFKARMEHDLNELAGGIVTTIKEMVEARKEMNKAEAFKLNSRISLAFTPNTETYVCHSFAYVHGTLGMADGQWIGNANMEADYYGLDIEGVVGLALQCRVLTGMILKGMMIPVLNKDIDIIVAEWGNVVHVDYHTFRKMFVEGTLVKGVMYVVGTGDIGFIGDKNSLKCVGSETDDWKLKDGFTVSLLEVRRATEGKLNSQDAACMQHLDGMVDFVRELGISHIESKLSAIEDIFAGVAKDGVINPDSYYPAILSQICPEYVAQDKGLLTTVIADTCKGLIKDISNMSFKLGEGDQYRYLQSDYADMLLRHGVLREHEVYIPGMEAGKKIVLTRNPRADIVEFYIATTVSLEDILQRIQGLNCTDAMKGVISRMFIHACTGLVITPADEKLPASLGGSDFDGDGATVHTNKKFVAIAELQPDGSNDIPKAPKNNMVITSYGIEEIQGMMIDGIFGQKNPKTGKRITPTPIGILANHAMKMLAMAMLSDAELESIIELVVRPNIALLKKYRQSEEEYARMFDTADVRITNEDVMKSTEAYYRSDLSVASTRAYLADCARMGASVEGRGIDVNKTAELVYTGYFGVVSRKDVIGEAIKAKGLMSIKCLDTCKYDCALDYDAETKINTLNVWRRLPESDSVVTIASALTPVIDELVDYLVGRINEICTREVAVSCAEQTLVATCGRSKVDAADLENLSKIHSMVTGNDQLQSEDKKSYRRALANTVRCAFDNSATPIEVFASVKRASYNDENGMYSSFEHVCHQEYLQGVLYVADAEEYNTNTTVGYPCFVRDARFASEGDEIHMYGGVDLDNNIVAGKKVNGVWTLAVKNGKYYLTRDAVEHFAVPARTNEVIVRTKTFRVDKAENDFNSMPACTDKDSFGRFKVDSYRMALILDKMGAKIWNLFLPSEKVEMGNGKTAIRPQNTRLNKVMNTNGMFIDELYQFANNYNGGVETVVSGRFVHIDCKKNPMPQIMKKAAGATPARKVVVDTKKALDAGEILADF